MQQEQSTYRVIGPSDCPIAQAVELNLGLRRRAVTRQIGARPRLVVAQNAGLLSLAEGGRAMFDLLERLAPDAPLVPQQPDLRVQHALVADLAFRAAPALAQVIAARNLRDLDIAAYHLRDLSTRIETALPAAAIAQGSACALDAALLPLFWRIALLDLRHQAHLGDGLWHWAQRSGRMLRDPRLAMHFDRAAGRRFLDRLVRHGSALACDPRDEDWTGAFAGLTPRAVVPVGEKMRHSKINDIHYHISRI